MNKAHEACGGEEWRAMVRDVVIPWALGDGDLGDDVLEVGPGYGATTDVFRERVPKLTAVEIDHELATALQQRLQGTNVEVIEGDATALQFEDDHFSGATCFTMLHHVPSTELQDRLFAEVARVVRPGGLFVASDSVDREELRAHHEGDTYNPVDPETLAARLTAAGFRDIDVQTNELGWAATARAN